MLFVSVLHFSLNYVLNMDNLSQLHLRGCKTNVPHVEFLFLLKIHTRLRGIYLSVSLSC